MSTRNNENVNIDNVLVNIKRKHNFEKDKEIAELLGIKPADMANRKKSGTLLNLIFKWAINEQVSLDEIFYGQSGPENDFFKKLYKWMRETGGENQTWFENTCFAAFPMFKEWCIRKEEEESSKDSSFPKEKIA